ncbi:hypothetical protein, partial [Dolichospermum sp. UHCC 0299]|uniref:hypothetical protein n=1 Tax=Dolichospermum sp. UHCC 0299 TaxID=2590014 RepID=UPI001C2BCCE6
QALKPRLRSALTLSEAEGLTFGLPDRSCMTASPVEDETFLFQNSDSCFDFAQHKSSPYKSFTYC